jgi:hypothetical protein
MSWRMYRKTGFAEMRPFVPGEDLIGISVTPGVVPKAGDWIARDPLNHRDQWHITSDFFDRNYEECETVELGT